MYKHEPEAPTFILSLGEVDLRLFKISLGLGEVGLLTREDREFIERPGRVLRLPFLLVKRQATTQAGFSLHIPSQVAHKRPHTALYPALTCRVVQPHGMYTRSLQHRSKLGCVAAP